MKYVSKWQIFTRDYCRWEKTGSKANYSLEFCGRWVGFRVRRKELCGEYETQLWFGVFWFERSPWVFWG